MFGLSKDQILGLFRHVVTFVGGILVARGKLDPVALESIAGALVTLVGVFFSMVAPEKAPTSTIVVRPPARQDGDGAGAGAPASASVSSLVPNPGAKITLPPGA